MRIKEEASCRVCGGPIGRRFPVDEFLFGRCPRCGTIGKILTEAEYRNLPVTYDPGVELGELPEEELRSFFDLDTKKAILLRLAGADERPGEGKGLIRLLDIGCGMGGYLIAARDLGFAADGIEPSESHSRIGRDRFGLRIDTRYFDPSSAGENRYDIIILSHVIEHIYDQKAFLAGIYRILAPGGVIFIATPNAASTIAGMGGRSWSMLKPVDHVGLLTPAAMKLLIPSGADSRIETTENSWEPFVAFCSSCRNLLRDFRRRGLAKKAGGAPPPALAKRNSFRATKARINSLRMFRFFAKMISFPCHVFDVQSGRAACLVCEIRRPAGGSG